ncbi:MAG: sodium:calcium antiporter, partial [Nitrososphaerales archaeon]
VDGFRLDMIFLITSALIAVILFFDGYGLLDGIIFLGMFVAYLIFAFLEGNKEAKEERASEKQGSIKKGAIFFAGGGLGLFIAAEPFVIALEEVSVAIGVAPIAIALILSPIAGEMPEKLAIMILARKGERGVSIAVANVLGSKVLNNTLLLAVMVFAALFTATPIIQPAGLLSFTVAWAAIITLVAIGLMARRKRLLLRDGVILTSLYVGTIVLQLIIS